MPFDALRGIPIFGPLLRPAASIVSGRLASDVRGIAAGAVNVVTGIGRPEPEPVVTVINEPDPVANYLRIATLAVAVTGLGVTIFAISRKK